MEISRRAFVKAAPVLPLALGAEHASFDPWVELNAGHARHNVAEIARLTKGPILAVIKNNGYGAGVVEIARVLEPIADVHGFAVVKIDEAFRLRDAGLQKPVVLMGPYDGRHVRDLAARGIMPMMYTRPGREFEAAAAALGRPVRVHICVDTGLGRVGVPYREAADFIRALHEQSAIDRRSAIVVDGVMMTFTEDATFDQEQLARFTALCELLKRERVHVGRRHAASSYTLFQGASQPGGLTPFLLDMVRPGMAIFGVYPEAPFRTTGLLDLRPAVALRAGVVYVKRLLKGDSAGYNRAYVAPRDVWVATLPVGHADGVPRVAAKGANVRIGGALYPIVASVSASHVIVELGDEGRARIGDVATIFDWQEGSRPEDVSAACGASVYDLLMHLNPALPRRVL
ncbi:MAG: alanine racemase [Vicinamibacterales bacterium]